MVENLLSIKIIKINKKKKLVKMKYLIILILILANVFESNSEENDCKSPWVKESNTCNRVYAIGIKSNHIVI